MADQQNDVNDQNTELQSDTKRTGNEKGGQPTSIDNGVSAGEETENVGAAAAEAATNEQKEDNVETSSAYRVKADSSSSSDGSPSLPRSIHSQLRTTADEANTEMTSNVDCKLAGNKIFSDIKLSEMFC